MRSLIDVIDPVFHSEYSGASRQLFRDSTARKLYQVIVNATRRSSVLNVTRTDSTFPTDCSDVFCNREFGHILHIYSESPYIDPLKRVAVSMHVKPVSHYGLKTENCGLKIGTVTNWNKSS